MKSQSGLKVAKSRSVALSRKEEVFCDSLVSSLKVPDIIMEPVSYPKGTMLFTEGQAVRGLFAVRSGRVKLFTSSHEGKAIILKIAEAGELLGLPASLSGKPYEVTAEVSESAWVNFIPRKVFLRFLRANPAAFINVAQLLTDRYYVGHEMIQSLGFSRNAPEKMARFFLMWSDNHRSDQDCLRITFTHQEIGELIGVTRETVTRLLGDFKKRNLLTIDGHTFNICNRIELQRLANT
jgi:CRP/FNR family cyclic AMP-dependent transcriptional regulator